MTLTELIRRYGAGNTLQKSPPREEEHLLQVSCVKWLRLAHPELAPLFFAVPNGGQRDIRVARKLKAEGALAGVSDLLLLVPSGSYHGLAIEMKTKCGRLSPAQQAFRKAVTAHGYAHAVCRSLNEFRNTINDYLKSSLQ